MPRNIDVRIRFAYLRLKRKLAIYFTLWFLALLAGVSLVLDSIFISNEAIYLKLWSAFVVLLLSVKLAWDASKSARNEYNEFKEEHNQTEATLRELDRLE